MEYLCEDVKGPVGHTGPEPGKEIWAKAETGIIITEMYLKRGQ